MKGFNDFFCNINLLKLVMACMIIHLDEPHFEHKTAGVFFAYLAVQTCVLGAQSDRLTETFLLSIHNICFG